MPRVVHFELPVDNPERAVKFYSRVFDWKIEKWAGPQDYWLITTGDDSLPGINGGLAQRSGSIKAMTNSIDVPSVDTFAEKITSYGGKVVQPKMAIHGIGYIAYCQDTEGNVFSIMESDTSAK